MKKYFFTTLTVLILIFILFGLQKITTKHPSESVSGTAVNSASNHIDLSYKISQVKNSHVNINQVYDVYLVSNNETVTMVNEQDQGGGFDAGHPDYEGNYKLVAVKDGEGVSDFDLSNLAEQVTTSDFTDNKAHNGIQKFIDPVTGQVFIAVYAYGSSSTEVLFMFRVDDHGQIIPVKFYDNKGNGDAYVYTNFDGSVNSFFDEKTSLGVCSYYNTDATTVCSEYENRKGDFYLVKSKIFKGQPQLLK